MPTPEQGFSIEEARPQDREAIIELYIRELIRGFRGVPGVDEQDVIAYYDSNGFRERMRARLEPNPDTGSFVARLTDTNEIIGYTRASIDSDGEHWVNDLAVDQDHQGQKIGRELYRRNVQWHYKRNPGADIFLNAVRGSAAQAIYEHYGFATTDFKLVELNDEGRRLTLPTDKMKLIPPRRSETRG